MKHAGGIGAARATCFRGAGRLGLRRGGDLDTVWLTPGFRGAGVLVVDHLRGWSALATVSDGGRYQQQPGTCTRTGVCCSRLSGWAAP